MLRVMLRSPGIAANFLARFRSVHRADSKFWGTIHRRFVGRPAREQSGALTGNGINVRRGREPPNRSQPLARRTARAVTVTQAVREIRDTRAPIERQGFKLRRSFT